MLDVNIEFLYNVCNCKYCWKQGIPYYYSLKPMV